MGLESVELIMRVEEDFDIEIRDEEATELATVGQIYDCVLRKLGLNAPEHDTYLHPEKAWTEQKVWETLRAAVSDELSVDLALVTREAHIIFDLGAD